MMVLTVAKTKSMVIKTKTKTKTTKSSLVNVS